MSHLIKRAFQNSQLNIKLTHINMNYDKDKLYDARSAALSGKAIPDSSLDELIKLMGTVLPAPPLHLWPKLQSDVSPEVIGGLDLNPITTLPNTDWQVPAGNQFPMVGVFFTRDQFIAYVKSIGRDRLGWNPIGSCLHHTASPDLSMRPKGFEVRPGMNHMMNIRAGYLKDRGWNKGPHIFTDDNGIWVFSPLVSSGIHAVAFNSKYFGIEALGNFDGKDDPYSGRGKLSWDNSMYAAAVLAKYFNMPINNIAFHRDDPNTKKTCPGKKIDKTQTIETISEMYGQLK